MIKDIQVLYDFIEANRDKLENIYITSINEFGFNSYEGNQYQINFKVVTVEGYKNKLIKWVTNSSYTDDYVFDEEYSEDYSEKEYEELLKQGIEETILI